MLRRVLLQFSELDSMYSTAFSSLRVSSILGPCGDFPRPMYVIASPISPLAIRPRGPEISGPPTIGFPDVNALIVVHLS